MGCGIIVLFLLFSVDIIVIVIIITLLLQYVLGEDTWGAYMALPVIWQYCDVHVFAVGMSPLVLIYSVWVVVGWMYAYCGRAGDACHLL